MDREDVVKLINHLRVGHFADGEFDALSSRHVQKLSRLMPSTFG